AKIPGSPTGYDDPSTVIPAIGPAIARPVGWTEARENVADGIAEPEQGTGPRSRDGLPGRGGGRRH
ncbi:MAG: hypothetical protein LC647_05570, partial [Beggiatoa sp.]|nr:hypothetical protein [Beggiatoa sp.]